MKHGSGTKPDVSSLRVFGCSAYAHVPKAERRKLDSRTRKCVLLGYGINRKGCRLYDLGHMKVIHSRDVVFDEASMPGMEKEKETTIRYVELEIEEEPNRYGYNLTVASTEQQDPSSVAEARSASDKVKWEKAMEREMKSLHSNEVWELVEPPPDRKVVGNKWIFKRKVDADGAVERYKARLVAQGCTQKFGLDYEEMFSPVVRFESIRSVVALGAQHKLQLRMYPQPSSMESSLKKCT